MAKADHEVTETRRAGLGSPILAKISHSGWLKSTIVLVGARLLPSKFSKQRGGKWPNTCIPMLLNQYLVRRRP
ncbi:MAG TPA: hypothetical protein VFQ41_03865 [Candidatus Angelobacter sp.]|nr:hypothetical protein [Candidatus Angelobacter sp.]